IAQGAIAAKLRSTHNTYFTLPVLFVMISHHYPMTYGARENWLVLIAICAAGVLLRTYFVARHKAHERDGHTSLLPAALGVLTLAGVAFALLPSARVPPLADAGSVADGSFVRVEAIVARRCAGCHSVQPTLAGFTAAPNGVLLDTPEHILARTEQMHQQLATRAMPVGNVTGITEEERAEMLAWIERGAPH
ncbi:MAG TPA: urate hydroxylase PuuD, partial [Steroidobacteraceae bacterium]|nr:urate hydroxylase PuuD [Steroidobacteraceae bacterium]